MKFKISRNEIRLIFIMICLIVSQILSMLFEITIGTYLIFVIITFIYSIKRIDSISYLLLVLFLPNKYIQVLGLIIYILRRKEFYSFKLPKAVKLFLVFSLISGISNCIFFNGSYFNLLIQFSLYYIYFVIMYSLYKQEKLFIHENILNNMFILQIIVSLIQLIYYKQIGDSISGTLISAHYFGIFIIAYFHQYIKVNGFNKKSILLFIILLFEMYISDAKHVFVIYILALFLNRILTMMNIRKKLMVSVLLLVLFIGVTINFLEWSVKTNNSFSEIELVDTYVRNPNYNKKYIYFDNTFDELKSINGITGYGMGQYGSQISISRAEHTIYPYYNSEIRNEVAIRPFKNSIEGVMTKWYVEQGISLSSMVLGYPLVSFIPFIAELGIIGLLLLLNALDIFFIKNMDKTLAIMFFMLTIFDLYFEIPNVFIMLVFISIFFQNKKVLKDNNVDYRVKLDR